MQTETKTTVDEVLEQQKKIALIATVEAIDDAPGHVKVTPFIPGAGCSEEVARRVPRESIKHLVATGEKKLCCGKHLHVVEVHFAENASIPVREAFQQPQARGSHTPFETGAGQIMPEAFAAQPGMATSGSFAIPEFGFGPGNCSPVPVRICHTIHGPGGRVFSSCYTVFRSLC